MCSFLFQFFFYINYLKNDNQESKIDTNIKKETLAENKNNLIKNLRYEVKFDNDTEYIITSKLSEITYKNDIEIVEMQYVTAKIVDQKNLPLIIVSDRASYNNSNYNTAFSNNVSIKYIDNTINSENLELDFSENIVTIYNNVVYDSLAGSGTTDNIKIDLVTKKINIFMNSEKKKVELISK